MKKKLMLMAAMVAMVVVVSAPAQAQLVDVDIDIVCSLNLQVAANILGTSEDQVQNICNDFAEDGDIDAQELRDLLRELGLLGLLNGGGGNGGGGNGGGGPAVTQEVEQDAESGEVSQEFSVTGGGDNSNQCAGIQGVANTGNAQNNLGLVQYASEADDFEFEDVGSSIEVSPENSTTCDQQVNQAASAFGS